MVAQQAVTQVNDQVRAHEARVRMMQILTTEVSDCLWHPCLWWYNKCERVTSSPCSTVSELLR